MQVMNDRSKIAWNNKGGEINFYDVYTKQFYDKLTRKDFNQVNDIEMTKDDGLMCLTYGELINVLDVQSKNLLTSFNTGSTYGQCKLSNNFKYMIGSVGAYLIMHPTTISGIEGVQAQNPLIISPNPVSNNLTIQIHSETYGHYALSLMSLSGAVIDIINDGLLSASDQIINYDTRDMSGGTYFIRLELNNKVYTQQFIKE
jgi:hypothetical protein